MTTRIGLITVGGKGERMGKINTQKCLIQLDGKPVLEWVIEALEQSGIELIFLLTGHMHEQVSSYLANRLPDKNCVVAELYGGTKGQAQAVHRLQPFLKNESFVYAPGDVVPISNTIRDLIRAGEERPDHVAVCSREVKTKITRQPIQDLGESQIRTCLSDLPTERMIPKVI